MKYSELRGSAVLRFVSAAIPIVTVALLLDAAWTPALAGLINPANLTCGEPSLPGTVRLYIGQNIPSGGSTTFSIAVPIPGTDTPEQKCNAIATALTANGVKGVSSTGNVLTVNGVTGNETLWVDIARDTTGEGNTLSVSLLNPGDKVQLMEVPNAGLSVLPAGTTFHISVFETIGPTPSIIVNATAAANGTETEAALLSMLNNDITAALGPFIGTFTIPGISNIGLLTAPFDPTTVSVEWDANTSLDLANFGLEIVPGAAPEPATLALLGIGLAGLAFSRRRRKQ